MAGGRAIPRIHVWRPHRLDRLRLQRCDGVADEVPTHFHSGFQIGLIQSGTLVLTLEAAPSTEERAEVGSLVLLNPGQAHAMRSPGGVPVSALVLELEPECVEDALDGAGVQGAADTPRFTRSVVRDVHSAQLILDLHAALGKPSRQLAVHLLAELVQQLFALHGELEAPGSPGEHVCVEEVRRRLEAEPQRAVSLTELAEDSGVSRFQLVRAFRRELGVPPHEYQTQLRVNRAKELLDAGRTAAEVAIEVGFTDQSHLTRHFKRLTLMTPGDFARGLRRSAQERTS